MYAVPGTSWATSAIYAVQSWLPPVFSSFMLLLYQPREFLLASAIKMLMLAASGVDTLAVLIQPDSS
ncbi:hypothetical protein D3C81_2086850 [compost metagenome]